MNVGHGTDDAPRVPRRVSPTQPVDLTIGTWPIAPGQSVWVTWQAGTLAGAGSHGSVTAQWQRNHGANSYWGPRLGSFADGARVTYAVHASDAQETVEGGSFAVTVKPSLYIAWLWHHHQPLYRDPDASRPQGSYRQPWVRLHALRDYYSMAAIAAGHGVHLTVNLTPVLLRQIDDPIRSPFARTVLAGSNFSSTTRHRRISPSSSWGAFSPVRVGAKRRLAHSRRPPRGWRSGFTANIPGAAMTPPAVWVPDR